nr:hypothetical protein CFP56_77663 [Quercus suber]
MSSHLAGFPDEIIEEIVKLLEIGDICSLRLASPLLAIKTAQAHFKSFFRTKKVLITRTSLQRFVAAVKLGMPGNLLEDLSLVGVVNNTKRLAAKARGAARMHEHSRTQVQRDLAILTQRREDFELLHRSGDDANLLSEAFTDLARSRSSTRPFSIHLSVEVYRTDSVQPVPNSTRSDWKMIWKSAATTFNTTIRALMMSRMTVTRLSCFQHSNRCSIACNEIGIPGSIFDTLSLSTLKSLAVSLSDRIIEQTKTETGITGDSADEIDWEAAEDERSQSEMQADAANEENFAGLVELLLKSPALEDVDLHYYRLKASRGVDFHRHQTLQRVVGANVLPCLEKLTLRGFTVRSLDLLTLVERRPLRTLELKNVRLVFGSFHSIFKACTEKKPGMERLYFEDLFENDLVYFNEPRDTEPDALASLSSSILDRNGAKVQQLVFYQVRNGYVPGNPALYEWKREIRNIYGPP